MQIENIIYLNIYNDMGGKNGLNKVFTPDGIDLNSKGYALLSKHIDTLINHKITN
jgi:lysophospholipase L1-like esterase